MYQAVRKDSTYLIHYNKNHSKANGQFTSGDGDGDGIVNDHANQRKTQSNSDRLRSATAQAKKEKKTGTGLLIGSLGAWTVGALGAAAVDSGVDHPLAYAAALVGGVSAIGLDVAGTIVYDKANRKLRKETDRIIDEHYDAPITEAYRELQRA